MSQLPLPARRTLRFDVLSNFVGQGWSALVGLALVPLYISFMGMEAYGLVGFYTTLQSILSLFDFGISPTMNREMARYSTRPEKLDEARDLVRTLEVGYWVIGIVMGIAITGAAPLIATNWLNTRDLPIGTITRALQAIGVVLALQWPLSFYQGGLLGLQRQGLANGLIVIGTTLRGVGSLLVLTLVSPTVTAFFVWQILATAVYVSLTTLCLWRSLPRSSRGPRFRPHLVAQVWRFAAGMSATSLMTLILRQLDKVILSKLVSLELYGYYMLATLAAGGLSMLCTPMFNAVFPRMSALVAQGDVAALKALYHRGCQLVAVTIVPSAMVCGLFAHELLRLWTGSDSRAGMTAPILSILAIGTAINCLMGIPYDLQVAHGWTRFGFLQNLISVMLLGPATVFLAVHYGAVGAALVWPALNASCMLVALPIMHRRLLRGELRRWYVQDVLPPIAASGVVLTIARYLVPGSLPPLSMALAVGTASLAALTASALSVSYTRRWVVLQISRYRGRLLWRLTGLG